MKKYILLIMCILCTGMVFGCSKDAIFEFQKEEVQSFSVYTYDFEKEETTSNWVYHDEDMAEFLSYLENLSGTKTDTLDTEKLSGFFFGVELNIEDPFLILFAGDYAITHDGEYYLIDGEEAERMCQSIVGDTKVYDNVSYIMNHRYLSLLEGYWDTRFMTESNWTGEALENAKLSSAMTSVDVKSEILELTITNNTGSTMDFGSRLELETSVEGVWYNIENMINDNVNLGWDDMLYLMDSGNSIEEKFNFKYYQPLPAGRYRIIKEVKLNEKVGHVVYEFDMK
jgi:hypothetical protein